MNVRSARPSDFETLLALRFALWPDTDLEQHRRILTRRAESTARHETFVAVNADGAVSGFIELTRDGGAPGEAARVVLDAIFVTPSARRRGVAGTLLTAAEQWAHRRGAGVLGCDLDPEDAAALEAMDWLGFATAHTRVRLSRSVKAALDVSRSAAPEEPRVDEDADAPEGAGLSDDVTGAVLDPPLVIRPARSHGFLVFNVILFAVAVVSFALTDIYAKDMVRGALLPMLDATFVIYFLFVFLMTRYRRRADSSIRAERLFQHEP